MIVSKLESKMMFVVIAAHALFAFFIFWHHNSMNAQDANVVQAQLINAPSPSPAANSDKSSPKEPKKTFSKENPQKLSLKTIAPDKNMASSSQASNQSTQSQGSNTPSNVDISQLVILYKPDTEAFYPSFSKRVGEEGNVEVRLQIDENGIVQATQVVLSSGSPRLDKAATELAARIRFKPYLQNGSPSKVNAKIGVKFKLRD